MSRLVDVALASKIGANRIMALLGVFALLLATSSAQAQSWPFKKKTNDPRPASTQKDPNSSVTPSPAANYSGPKMRLAVMDLSGSALKTQTSSSPASTTTTVAIPPPSDFARGMTEMLTTALVKTNRFIVLERAVMDKVVLEQDFGASGRVNAETAPKAGKIIGAQAMITGDITEFSYSKSSMGGNMQVLRGFGAKMDKVTALVALDIRVIDAATGEVLASQRAQGKAQMSNVSTDVTAGGSTFNVGAGENTPLGQATRQALQGAVTAIVAGMQKARWSARVIDFRNGMLYVNAGSDMGIQPAMELAVFRPQEALVDPDTGKSIGTPDEKIGTVVVDSVQEKYCVAKVLSGTDMKRGDVVRFKDDAKQP
ncbi:MAG TPA: CsgG/HfaB family protein [Candidatus Sulfotelmatobacter sp.]|nr:CsgG/HfaB family protein [Candidatus Sulfotelmatobacter sp.]